MVAWSGLFLLTEFIEQRLDASLRHLDILLAGPAADADRADHLTVDDDGNAALERRDLAAAGALKAQTQEQVRFALGGHRAGLLAERRRGDGLGQRGCGARG